MFLRQMRYFVAVVDCGSFTEAAEKCYISQSAISQQIRALETELGVELLHRANRRFSLTPAGEYFCTHARAILAQADALRQDMARMARGGAPQLRIGYLRSYSGLELYQAVAEFSRRHPEADLSIVNGTHEELYDLLRGGGVDLILSDQRRAFSDRYVNDRLLRCRCYAELSLRSPLAGRAAVELGELWQTPCILFASREQRNTEQEYFRDTLGFGGQFLFADTLEEGRLLVTGTRGFLPVESAGTLPPPAAGTCRLPILQEGRPLYRNYCLFWTRANENPYLEEFAALLRELLPARQPDGDGTAAGENATESRAR